MALISIDRTKCKKDGICVAECPFKLISLSEEDGFPEVRPAAARLCILCGHCAAVCPQGALRLAALPEERFRPISNGALPDLKKTRQLFTTRRSIRNYATETVPRETITQLIDLCRWAPSAKNRQPVHWLVVEHSEEVRKLAGLVVDWLKIDSAYPGIVSAFAEGRDMVLRDAPHLLVAHAREDNHWAATDCTIALTHFDLAAGTCGLGACWAGIFMGAVAAGHPPLIEALALPEKHRAFGALIFGYPRYPYFKIPPRKEARITWR